jgi:hypothetical protein
MWTGDRLTLQKDVPHVPQGRHFLAFYRDGVHSNEQDKQQQCVAPFVLLLVRRNGCAAACEVKRVCCCL